MKKYKAIMFDLDGVIVDSMPRHVDSWQMVFRDYGIEIPAIEIYRREGMAGLVSIVDILQSRGIDVPDEDRMQALLKKKLSIFEKEKISLYPAASEILRLTRAGGLGTALVTGSLRRTVMHMLPESILSSFDVLVPVDAYKNGKPHPEPYLKAINLLSVEAGESLAIENAPMGIRSAKASGADCFAIESTLDASYLNEADKIFKDHEDLLRYFKENL